MGTTAMTTPVWVLLAFAGWTILVLAASVGVYRWARILTGRHTPATYGDITEHQGLDWYKRAMRAHANCMENLPIYGAVVLAIVAAGLDAPILDVLALVLIAARVAHTLVHVSMAQTSVVVCFRSTFFIVQLVCMVWMGVYVALHTS